MRDSLNWFWIKKQWQTNKKVKTDKYTNKTKKTKDKTNKYTVKKRSPEAECGCQSEIQSGWPKTTFSFSQKSISKFLDFPGPFQDISR